MKVRTLIVDDSPTMRAILGGLLSRDPGIEIVGTAESPSVAREMIKALNPDVVTLDIEMPGMDGLDFLEKIMRLRPMPVVMVSTLTEQGSHESIRALELGAFDCYPKPDQAVLRDRAGDGGALATIVKAAAQASHVSLRDAAPAPPKGYCPKAGAILAIGASTGGVEALLHLLRCFPANCPPTVIVQHMPEAFTRSFAERLNRACLPEVTLAENGLQVIPGRVIIARGGHHLTVQPGHPPTCRLDDGVRHSGHRPSVDILFHSIAKGGFSHPTGLILTGMGADGADGLRAMFESGARTFGQDEASSVVYGMPGAAYRLGAVETQLPLTRLAPRILAACSA